MEGGGKKREIRMHITSSILYMHAMYITSSTRISFTVFVSSHIIRAHGHLGWRQHAGAGDGGVKRPWRKRLTSQISLIMIISFGCVCLSQL